ncbi:ABC transporter substrate-binding protein [Thermophagus sp. OGC60D27]|uniref:ABC transporter substrate-binding protein n=1 Tax=Thermophagus sp. OGC60D27 TaxID=3458415 RepID=UPI0040377F2C
MVLKKLLSGLLTVVLFSSCHVATQKDSVIDLFANLKPDSVFRPSYAKGFSITYYDSLKLIHIADPWDQTAEGDYILVGSGECPQQFQNHLLPYVTYPVTNWSAFSSTQIEFAAKIGVLESLGSVAEPQYISNFYVQANLNEGRIKNVGMAGSPDIEVLLASSPQFVFVSPFKDNRYGPIEEAGLLLIYDCSYLEVSPLGRAEWLVFFSAFYDKEEVAISQFKEIENRYQAIARRAKSVVPRPTVFTGYLFNDVWYMPAGESYVAKLFEDAGAAYRYRNRPGAGSLALDFETVFNDFYSSDVWVLTVNHQGDFTTSDLLQMDGRYSGFESFKKGKVLISNSRYSGFYEKGIVEPHVILNDLAYYLHPDLFQEYEPVYFHWLKNDNQGGK